MEAARIAKESLDVTDKDIGRRLSLAQQSVQLTRTRYGYVLPQAEDRALPRPDGRRPARLFHRRRHQSGLRRLDLARDAVSRL
jgi:hypothetical protein